MQKIKHLGFITLEFDEEALFTDNKWRIFTDFDKNLSFVYLDNIECIPNYESDVVEYKTNASNYRINCDHFFVHNRLLVNSLVFDSNCLPDVITIKSTFDKIVALKTMQVQNCEAIKNSVDLSANIIYFYLLLDSLDRIVDRFSDESKNDLLQILTDIKSNLETLATFSSKYDNGIIDSNSGVTQKKLTKELDGYFRRKLGNI